MDYKTTRNLTKETYEGKMMKAIDFYLQDDESWRGAIELKTGQNSGRLYDFPNLRLSKIDIEYERPIAFRDIELPNKPIKLVVEFQIDQDEDHVLYRLTDEEIVRGN